MDDPPTPTLLVTGYALSASAMLLACGLILAVLVLLALTPVVSRGAHWLRVASVILGVIMTGNALAHIGPSLYWGKFAPGVYSSPILLVAAVALLVTASRAKVRGA